MKDARVEELVNIYGGTTTVTSSVINAFTNIIKVLMEAGHGVGSAIRRIGENNLCPLE